MTFLLKEIPEFLLIRVIAGLELDEEDEAPIRTLDEGDEKRAVVGDSKCWGSFLVVSRDVCDTLDPPFKGVAGFVIAVDEGEAEADDIKGERNGVANFLREAAIEACVGRNELDLVTGVEGIDEVVSRDHEGEDFGSGWGCDWKKSDDYHLVGYNIEKLTVSGLGSALMRFGERGESES